MTDNQKAASDRRPIIISGPSGVGKGTLITKLRGAYPDTFATTVSHTTRQPRAGEHEGEAYYFVSTAAFATLKAQHAFVESAHVSGNSYGTSKQTVREQTAKGRIVLLDIDVQGARAIKADADMQARYVFVRPPSCEALEARLRRRRTETEEQIQTRLARARLELEEAQRDGLYEVVIVNDDLEVAFGELVRFVFGTAT